ncbi:MAG: heavy metal-binding domain-containing protein [Candidatus Sericytochromatia bacterium]
MRLSLLLASALLLASPGAALAQAPHGHEGHGTARPVTPSRQQVAAAGLKATFQIQAPAKAAYTCAMHPEVVSARPGTCAKCGGMTLVKQTHRIALHVTDAAGKPVPGALVRLVTKDAKGLVQGLTLTGNGRYEGTFHLRPGAVKLSAFVKPPQAAKAVELSVPYEVK